MSRDLDNVKHRLSSRYGQVVAYDWARCVLVELGCGLRRETDDDGDFLLVFSQSREGTNTGYVSKEEKSEDDSIGMLTVDEGVWNHPQEFGGEVSEWSKPWREYVDFVDLSRAVLRKLDPDKAGECNGGAFMGRGFRQQHLSKMVRERLVEIGYWSAPKDREDA